MGSQVTLKNKVLWWIHWCINQYMEAKASLSSWYVWTEISSCFCWSTSRVCCDPLMKIRFSTGSSTGLSHSVAQVLSFRQKLFWAETPGGERGSGWDLLPRCEKEAFRSRTKINAQCTALDSDLECSPTKTFRLQQGCNRRWAIPSFHNSHFDQRPKPLQFQAMLSKGLSCKLYKSLGGSVLTNQNSFYWLPPTTNHTQPIRLMRLGAKANAELHHLHMKALIWKGGWACHGFLKKILPFGRFVVSHFRVEVDEVSGSTYRKIKVI